MKKPHPGLANLIPFKPGDPRINRNGRKRGGTPLADRLWSEINKADPKSKRGEKQLAALIARLIRRAIAGDMRAIELIFDRIDGRAPIAIELPPQPKNEPPAAERLERIRGLIARFNLAAPIDADTVPPASMVCSGHAETPQAAENSPTP